MFCIPSPFPATRTEEIRQDFTVTSTRPTQYRTESGHSPFEKHRKFAKRIHHECLVLKETEWNTIRGKPGGLRQVKFTRPRTVPRGEIWKCYSLSLKVQALNCASLEKGGASVPARREPRGTAREYALPTLGSRVSPPHSGLPSGPSPPWARESALPTLGSQVGAPHPWLPLAESLHSMEEPSLGIGPMASYCSFR